MAHRDPTPPRGLTPKGIASLPAKSKPYDLIDTRIPGLKLRVLPSRRKVFRWVYWRGTGPARTQTTLTIGTWAMEPGPGVVTLDEARDRLERLKRAHEVGCLDEAAHAMKARPTAGKTVQELAEEWYRRAIAGTRRRPEEVRRTLDTDILPAIGTKPAVAVTPVDCRSIVLGVIDRGAPSHAGKVLDHLRQLFRWMEGFGEEIARNPAAVLDKGALGVRTRKGNRTLTAEEIPVFWAALERHRPGLRRLSPPVQIALRLLLLTGVRTGELLRARRTELDLEAGTWTIPVEHQKLNPRQIPDARPWVVPLVPEVVALLRELVRLEKRSPWVVASPVESESGRPEHVTEKALSHALRGLFDQELLDVPGGRFTPHDLRRTVRTKLSELGVALHIAERCLNHALGRIAETYDRHDYLGERRAALELWTAYVYRLLAPGESNVAFLPGAR